MAVDTALAPEAADTGRTGSARVVRYEATLVDVAIEAEGRRLLLLSDAYYPGWQAFVDGLEVPILRADHALRALTVPAGRHTVRFVYAPGSLRLGAAVSALGLLVLLGLVASPRRSS